MVVVSQVLKQGGSPESAQAFTTAAAVQQQHQQIPPIAAAGMHPYPQSANPAGGMIGGAPPGAVGAPLSQPAAGPNQHQIIHQTQQQALTSPVLPHLVPIHHPHLHHPGGGIPGQAPPPQPPQQTHPSGGAGAALPVGSSVATPQGAVLNAVAPTQAAAAAGMQIIHAGNVTGAAPANAHFMAAAAVAAQQQQQQQVAAAAAAVAGAAAAVASHAGVVHVPPPPAGYIQAGAPYATGPANPQLPHGPSSNSHPVLHHHPHHHPTFVTQSATVAPIPPPPAQPAPAPHN